jgi:hypothetical protein
VRLEEWQKFIETQFLEDTPEEATPQQEASEFRQEANTVSESPAPAYGERIQSENSELPTEAVVRDTLLSEQLSDQEVAARSVHFPTPTLPETEIPAFVHYLPPYKRITQESAPSKSKEPLAKKTVPPVRSDATPANLSGAELWAKVPKHVQILLDLERRDAEEVAQNSYKRPFAEKRRELIERILDPVLSLEDTARLLNVCPATVRRYTNKGILNYYRKEPERSMKNGASPEKETRQRRFRLSDILAFLETQQGVLDEESLSSSGRDSEEPSEAAPTVEMNA